ncbi:ABC transporter substrate-binding protein [Paenibacillus sp. CAA11]|uniref:ABC transporter substrate-binding protein n=1 Tax=Paenibacillus sp. CAA11 TaxID=1532905 RepID=UPI000D3CF49D|nr:ABC transporter substrate-binding protein [Paenibacillus sp. CAA11]AWB44789.1 ABC transporter substrate-binding protein [Paenibacillus sp. CAA11]
MKTSKLVLVSAFVAGLMVLSACSNSNEQASQNASNSPSSKGSSNAVTTTATSLEPVQAADLSKLPDIAKKRTDTIIVGLTDPSGAFTPYFHQSGYDGNVSSLLYTPLVTLDEKGLPEAAIAESWDISEDELTYTFHLAQDAKFSDGSPLTAEDVAFTWTLINDKAYDGDSTLNSIGIKGAKDYKEGKASAISGIKIIDPHTISATIEKPDATALTTLGSAVLSKAYYGKDYKFGQLDYIKKLHEKPLGNGPYKLDKFIPGQEVRFVANEYYYKGKPKTERFIYKTSEGDVWQYLETGEVDYATFNATQENLDKLKSLGFVNIIPYTPSNYGYLQLNLEHEQLKSKKVRQALTYGLDRQSIYVDANQGAGQVANIPSSPISWSYTEEGINPYKFDPEKAKQLLDEAGWKEGAGGIREKDGKKLTIHFLGSKNAGTDTFIAMASENYKEIGVDFQPEVFADFNALVSKVESGDYDMASFSTSILSDPSEGLVQFVDGEIKGYNNPEFNKLYQQGLETSDIEARKKVYSQLYKIANEDLPVIFTSYKKTVSAYNGRIENLKINPFVGLSQTIPAWTLK